MKAKVLTKINVIISTLLGLLGLQSCVFQVKYGMPPIEPGIEKYGIPMAEFVVEGQVTNEAEEPLQDMRVVIDSNPYDEYADTLYTNKDGEYLFKAEGFPADSMKVKVEDPTGVYAADSTKVGLTYSGSDDDWYVGTANVEADFTLKKTENDK